MQLSKPEDMSSDSTPKRVAYLLGAGSTHGAAKFAGSTVSLIMDGLRDELLLRMRDVFDDEFAEHEGIKNLVNNVVNDSTDFEHLLTFLADTPSGAFQDFAERLKSVFFTVLKEALDKARAETGEDHSKLYAALVDMHAVTGSGENLVGFLTLNYDSYLEHGIKTVGGRGLDYGIAVSREGEVVNPIPVLKLHGSFDWRHTWPLEVADGLEVACWIPPGIRKVKAEYPFSGIWSAARELLDCDVLRIVGCRLGANDWDLVSLLFSTMHGTEHAGPYVIEVIGPPSAARRIAREFPYLEVRSILEVEDVGDQLVSEVLACEPTKFATLDDDQQKLAVEHADSKITNAFSHWLRVKGELMLQDLPSIKTECGVFDEFVGAFN